MNWTEARRIIEDALESGTDLNTQASKLRFLKEKDAVFSSRPYRYQRQSGLAVSIGKRDVLKIPWSMLEACFEALQGSEGYSRTFFRPRFPLQATDHPCHVHVIGMIFVRAGLADTDGKRYWAVP